MQATWNLHERSAGDALARAHAAGLRVYVKEALANGRLTARGGDAALAALARERGRGADQIALAAALAQPWADVVLSGAATVAQLESNLGAREVVWDARWSGGSAGWPRTRPRTGRRGRSWPGTEGARTRDPAALPGCTSPVRPCSVRSPGSPVAREPDAEQHRDHGRARPPTRSRAPHPHAAAPPLGQPLRPEQRVDHRGLEPEPARAAPVDDRVRARAPGRPRRVGGREPRDQRGVGARGRGTARTGAPARRGSRRGAARSRPRASTTPGDLGAAAPAPAAPMRRRGCQAWMPHSQAGAGAACAASPAHAAVSHAPPAGHGAGCCGPASRSSPLSPTTDQVRRP